MVSLCLHFASFLWFDFVLLLQYFWWLLLEESEFHQHSFLNLIGRHPHLRSALSKMLSVHQVLGTSTTPLILTPQEKRSLEADANMVSIIHSVEQLEKAFVSGLIEPKEYERLCNALISQFKVAQAALKEKYPDFGTFWSDHKLDAPLARERLLSWGVPASMLYDVGNQEDNSASLHVFDACTFTTTLIDSLKMNMRAVDEILPTLKETLGCVNKIRGLPKDLEARQKLEQWLSTLHNMAADDVLTESQARQFAFDVEQFYVGIHNWLKELQEKNVNKK